MYPANIPIMNWSSISSFVCFVWVYVFVKKEGRAERQKRKNGDQKQQSGERQCQREKERDRKTQRQEKRLCLTMCTYIACEVMSSLFLLGGVPGLASCQPSGEPNDSFDPIRISAKSTLCSLRACTRQLTKRPPSMPTLCANQPCPASARLTCRHWVNTAARRRHFAESVLTQQTLN